MLYESTPENFGYSFIDKEHVKDQWMESDYLGILGQEGSVMRHHLENRRYEKHT